MAGLLTTVFQIVLLAFVGRMIHRIIKSSSKGQDIAARPSSKGKVTAGLNRTSVNVRREMQRLDRNNRRHEAVQEHCKYTYVTQDPNFDFNGSQTVDEFAVLRRRNAAHERHLRDRITGV